MNAIEEKFNQLMQTTGVLDKNVRAAAEMFFYSGAGYALKEEPVNLCALVCPGGTGTDVYFKLVEKAVPGVQAIKSLQSLKKNESLSQQDLQFLSYMLRNILNEMESHKHTCNRAVDYYWQRSIPDDENPISQANFRALNGYKDSKREIKAKAKKMAEIQRKIKTTLRK